MQGDATSNKSISLKSLLFSKVGPQFLLKFFPQSLNKQLLKIPAFESLFMKPLLQQPEMTLMTKVLTVNDL